VLIRNERTPPNDAIVFGGVRVYGDAVDLWTVLGDLEDDKAGGWADDNVQCAFTTFSRHTLVARTTTSLFLRLSLSLSLSRLRPMIP